MSNGPLAQRGTSQADSGRLRPPPAAAGRRRSLITRVIIAVISCQMAFCLKIADLFAGISKPNS